MNFISRFNASIQFSFFFFKFHWNLFSRSFNRLKIKDSIKQKPIQKHLCQQQWSYNGNLNFYFKRDHSLCLKERKMWLGMKNENSRKSKFPVKCKRNTCQLYISSYQDSKLARNIINCFTNPILLFLFSTVYDESNVWISSLQSCFFHWKTQGGKILLRWVQA